ncbi:MAG: HDOD domain-containing protein [Woeseiaceae bacterium]
MENIFVARQPIYDKAQELMGFELLYRSGKSDTADFSDGSVASSEVIMNSFMNIGVDSLVGSAKAFINITKELVLNEALTPMFENQTVLEILEDIEPTAEIIAGVQRLKDQGYEIALDDFEYTPQYDALLAVADYVKVDVIALTTEEVIDLITILKNHNVKLVAEKIETQEMYKFCVSLDFDYYQGFYFCKPQLVTKKHAKSNKIVVLNILEKLESPFYDLDDIEKTLSMDAVLTFKLLRYVNSAAFAKRKEIESIREAIFLVGGNTIKKWATLILMTQLMEGKPQALLVTALIRAKMCELVAEKKNINNEQMFTIGLLSLIDALMDMEMIDLLDELTLSTSIKLALLDYEGESGSILHNIIHYEKGEWDKLLENSVNADMFSECYIEAVKWADSTIESLKY